MRDINVYGFIGDGWDETDMTATKFANELKEANGEAVTIHVNSGGGDVFDANTMAELLRSYQGDSTCIIEGLAASAASYFALTADKVVIGDSALMMIHNPYSFSGGTAEDLRKTADFLDKVKSTIVNQYVRKTGKDEGAISDLMDAETWFTAKEAVENGFCDSIVAMEPVAACIDPEQAKRFKNAPKDLLDAPAVVDGNGAGETEPIIPGSNNGGKAVSGADKVETGAVSKTVCVNGKFLTY